MECVSNYAKRKMSARSSERRRSRTETKRRRIADRLLTRVGRSLHHCPKATKSLCWVPDLASESLSSKTSCPIPSQRYRRELT